MTPLAWWRPRWARPHESLFSAAVKIGFLSTASLAECLEQLTGASRRGRLPIWAPNEAAALNAIHSLRLDAVRGRQLFWAVGSGAELAARTHLRIALRWCPQCLMQWFHSVRFQDARQLRCPWHGCAISETCPHCRMPVDPLQADGWVCGSCKGPIALDLPPLSQLGRSELGRAIHGDQTTLVRRYRSGDGSTLTVMRESVRPREPVWFADEMGMRRWIDWMAFEESSAIADALLGPHMLCARRHWSDFSFASVRYSCRCPVAGGVFRVLECLGMKPEALGGWIPRPARSWSDMGLINHFLYSHSPWLYPVLVRSIVRAWTVDALLAFEALASEDYPLVDWRPAHEGWKAVGAAWAPCVNESDGEATIRNLVSAREVACAVKRASFACASSARLRRCPAGS